MNTQLYDNKGYMTLKLDLRKAYDRVEWAFIRVMMSKLDFAAEWIDLILNCITTFSFSILVNDIPQQRFKPQRGLRQGCHLSSYLFIFCTEALSSQLYTAKQQRLITGVPFARGQIRMNHLFFTDNSLLFCQANMQE